ncbi:hypothetical protein CRUP_024783 [Coryphaenoides rupestris]|nr:hypothetical protein CRUP_024783 [Coryphaenoides rupestris]
MCGGGSGADDGHQGTHSSAGIPSLLNSPTLHLHHPLSSSSSSNQNNNNAAMTPSAIPPPASVSVPPPSTPLPPFKFRARRESVDWRRVGALDVDRVAAELDVDSLQRHVAAVAFCSLEGERCPACRAPLDPALAKLFRLAQLTVEWLLHCQAALAGHLADAERAAAAAGDAERRLEARHARLEERARTLAGELRQRKRVIRAQQQGMLGPRCLGNHKCAHCDKSFINSTFLQNHLQRRHPDEFEMQSRSDSEEKKKKKSQLDALQAEISELKEQLLQQQHTLLAKSVQEKEQESLQRDVVRELDRFRAEEMSRVERKIEESREGIRREMEILYARNLQARIEAEHSQTSRRETAEREQDAAAAVDAAAQTHAIQRLELQLKKQRSREEMERRLQERERTISSQREQIKNLSSHPPATKVVEVPVVVTATAPEPKPKRLVREEAPLPQQLEPIQEMSEEDRDSSSVSEKRRPPAVSAVVSVSSVDSRRSEARERPSPATLRRNPGLLKDLRPALEHALADRLEDLGVRPVRSTPERSDLFYYQQ